MADQLDPAVEHEDEGSDHGHDDGELDHGRRITKARRRCEVEQALFIGDELGRRDYGLGRGVAMGSDGVPNRAEVTRFDERIPATPAGEAANYILTHLATRGRDVTSESALPFYPDAGDPGGLAALKQRFFDGSSGIGHRFEVYDLTVVEDYRLGAVLTNPRGQLFSFGVAVRKRPPHHVSGVQLVPVLPGGVRIRHARVDDAATLRTVSQRSPLRLSDRTVTIDPGDDYFAAMRLMAAPVHQYVAVDDDDCPIGIHCGVSYPIRINGKDGRAFLIFNARLLPEHEGSGIWRRLIGALSSHYQTGTVNFGNLVFIHPENDRSLKAVTGALWPTKPARAVLDCRAVGDAPPVAARQASAADAPGIVDVLNAHHLNEELYRPYTTETFSERLARDPALYEWADVRMTDRAVLGVWSSGEIRTTRLADGTTTESRRAVALDYGYLPGAEGEFRALVADACRRLAADGVTHLGLFTSPPSKSYELLMTMASSMEPYVVGGLREFPNASAHGVYIDAVHF